MTVSAESLPSTRAAPARPRVAPASLATLLIGAVTIAIYFLLPRHAQSVVYVLIGLVAVSLIYLGVLRNLPRGERLPWQLFAFGLLCQVAGDAIFAFYEVDLNREPLSPSVADVFYLAGYPLLAAGIFLVLRRLGAQSGRAAVLDSIVVFGGVALVQWVFFIDQYNHIHFSTQAARVVAMAYPAVDALLLVGFAQLLVGPGGRTAAYRLLLLSVALWIVADEIYGLDIDGYSGGSWIDMLWLGSYVVWAAAALDPSMRNIAQPDRRQLPRLTTTRLALLAAALLTAPATLILERTAHHAVHAYAIGVVGAIVAALVLMRLAGLVHVVERSRRDERLARQEAEQAQHLLADQNEQLVELDRLKDEFVSSVSHELRTPLTSISGYVELMLEDETRAETRAHLAIVERNAQRLLGLVTDLLFTARLQEGRLELERAEVDLAQLATQALESARPRAEVAGVNLELDLSDVPPIAGEPVRLAQLLDNLISNAIKFTPVDGHVRVGLHARDGLVCLEVSDTGIGISEAERERLFERFFRSQGALERQIQGTGLGLYISKAIVEAHNGRIAVKSTEGKGTTFIVELPVSG